MGSLGSAAVAPEQASAEARKSLASAAAALASIRPATYTQPHSSPAMCKGVAAALSQVPFSQPHLDKATSMTPVRQTLPADQFQRSVIGSRVVATRTQQSPSQLSPAQMS